MALRSTQPLTERRTRNFPGGKGWLAHKADNLTAICEFRCLENVRALPSNNSVGLHGLLTGIALSFLPLSHTHTHNHYSTNGGDEERG
jgi:hypothetical protein